MPEKCVLCGEKVEESFLDKKNGTVVKIKEKDKNIKYYACNNCQKKYSNIREEITKKVS